MKKKFFCFAAVMILVLCTISVSFAASATNVTDQSYMSQMAWLCHYNSYATVSVNNPSHNVIHAPVSSPRDEVKMVQDIMRNCDTCSNITVDGIFGSETKTAVKDVQRKYQVTRDGIVGTNTWKLICKESRVSSRSGGSSYAIVIFCPDPYYTSVQYAQTIKYTISSTNGLHWYYGTSSLELDI